MSELEKLAVEDLVSLHVQPIASGAEWTIVDQILSLWPISAPFTGRSWIFNGYQDPVVSHANRLIVPIQVFPSLQVFRTSLVRTILAAADIEDQNKSTSWRECWADLHAGLGLKGFGLDAMLCNPMDALDAERDPLLAEEAVRIRVSSLIPCGTVIGLPDKEYTGWAAFDRRKTGIVGGIAIHEVLAVGTPSYKPPPPVKSRWQRLREPV